MQNKRRREPTTWRWSSATPWSRVRAVAAAVAAGSAGVVVAVALGAGPVLTSPVQTVNSGHAGPSGQPRVAMGTGGSYVVAYLHVPPAGETDVFVRRYSAGDVADTRREVNATTDLRAAQDVATNAAGQVVVVYVRNIAGVPNLKAQRFGSDGDQVGAEIAVNTTAGDYYYSRVAMAPDGRFVVTWRKPQSGVVARVFEPDGDPATGEIDVGTLASQGGDPVPEVAVDAAGKFIVVWPNGVPPADQPGRVKARRFDEAGVPAGAAFDAFVGSNGSGYLQPTVALADDGAAVVVFYGIKSEPPIMGTLLAQRVGASGPTGNLIQVNEVYGSLDVYPSVAADGAGNFAVSWLRQTNVDNIYVREFTANGAPRDGESLVAGGLSQGSGISHDVGLRAGQAPIVAWGGVFARRVTSGTPTTPTGTTPTETTTAATTPTTATTTATTQATQPPTQTAPPPATATAQTAPSRAPAPPAAPLPAFASAVTLPSAKQCTSRRSFRIRIRRLPGGTVITRAEVRVNGRRVQVVRGGRLIAPVNLRNLPRGRFTVEISVTTADGRKISGKRRYRTCAPGKRGGKQGPL